MAGNGERGIRHTGMKADQIPEAVPNIYSERTTEHGAAGENQKMNDEDQQEAAPANI